MLRTLLYSACQWSPYPLWVWWLVHRTKELHWPLLPDTVGQLLHKAQGQRLPISHCTTTANCQISLHSKREDSLTSQLSLKDPKTDRWPYLNHQNAWHNWPLWEVARKEVIIDGHILDGNNRHTWIVLNNSVYQQKWKPGSPQYATQILELQLVKAFTNDLRGSIIIALECYKVTLCMWSKGKTNALQ